MKLKFFYKILWLIPLSMLWIGEANAQLEFKLQLLENTTKWGVYVRHNGTGNSPSVNTITGSGQVTIVAPNGFSFQNLTAIAGQWTQNARVNGPAENSSRDYISVGFNYDDPKIIYYDTSETLMFTFTAPTCPDTLYLIDNNTDPFNVLPNSAGTNPGNDLGVYDVDESTTYNWVGNYAFSAWSCHDCDGDGLLNATEDTNGNGVFDVGDDSHLCDPCDPFHPEYATIQGDTTFCSTEDTVVITVTIEGGWPPYDVRIVNTSGDTLDIDDYTSGDPILVSPVGSETYTIHSVIDSFLCEPDTIYGSAVVTVEGPISFTDHPDNVTECSGNSTSFSVAAQNDGDGTISYNWQTSTNGTDFTDLDNGTPYTGAFSTTLQISNVAGLDNRYYRCKIFTSTCDTVFSNAATLNVEGPLTITLNPIDSTECADNAASFTASASNAGDGTINYRWQLSTNGGSSYTDLSTGGVYLGATGTGNNGTLSISNVIGLNGNRYRMKVWTNECDTVFTTGALLTVQGPIAINTHPVDVSQCAGQSINFIVGATNSAAGTLLYRWQISRDTGGSWQNLDNDETFNGVRNDTLSVDISDTLDGTQYRVLVSTSECATITSNVATLSISDQADFSLNPSDVEVCATENVIFAASATVAQGSFTYQWMVSTDNGLNWVDLTNNATYSGVTNDTLSITNAGVALNGYLYRVEARTVNCDPSPSGSARLTIQGPLSISAQPQPDTICDGEIALFDVTALNPGSGITGYQWQVSLDGGSNWTNLSNNVTYNGTRTNELSVRGDGGLDSAEYRVRIFTSLCDTINSDAAQLIVEGPIQIVLHPDDEYFCDEGPGSFTAEIRNAGSGTMTYTWHYSLDSGLNWIPIDAGTLGGIFTDYTGQITNSDTTEVTLNISDVAGMGYWQFKVVASTGTCANVETLPGTLLVEGQLSIDAAGQPDDVIVCSETSVSFITFVDNTGVGTIFYQWQTKVHPDSSWRDLRNDTLFGGVTTDTLVVLDPQASMNGDSFRVLARTATCSDVISEAALLTIEGPFIFTSHPANRRICADANTTFAGAVQNDGAGTPLYQWYVSADTGQTWTALTNGGVYSNVDAATLNLTGVDSTYDGLQYRLGVGTANCAEVYSNIATLTIEGPVNFTDMPDNVTTCSGENVNFEITATAGTANTTIVYQWQVRPAAAGVWVNATNGLVYNGVSSPLLGIGNTAGLDSLLVRCIIRTNLSCSRDTSEVALLRVEGPLSFPANGHPDDFAACSGETAFFTAAPINAGAGTIQYRWRVSSDSLNFSTIGAGTDGGVYAGYDSDTLVISNTTGLHGRYYRLEVFTNECSPVNSDVARLTVEGPVTINDQPDNITTCDAKSIFFAVGTSNPTFGSSNFQWQRSRDGGTSWSNLNSNDSTFNGVRTDTLSISDAVSDSINGDQFRVIVWVGTQQCNMDTSNAATITIEGPISFDDHPADTTVCSGSPAYFEVTTDNGSGSGTMVYQWQTSTNGVVWNNLSNAGVYSGVATDRLDISDVAGLGGRRYRVRISTLYCDPIFSNPARLTVNGPVNFTDQPDDVLACENEDYFFNATVVNGGQGAITFQWEVSDDGSSWSTLTGNQWIRGVNTPVLQLDSMPLMRENGDTVFRLRVDLATCAPFYSDIVNLTIVSDTLGFCDYDLDGAVNDLDGDDDNDGLNDYVVINGDTFVVVGDGGGGFDTIPGTNWEYSCMTYGQFNRDVDDDEDLDGEEDWDDDGITNSEETDGDGILDGDPCDPCDPLISRSCFGIALNLRANLYGAAFNGVNNIDTLMKDSLRRQGIIPLTEPYSYITSGTPNYDTLFKHKGGGGGETISDSAAILGVTGGDAIVDWVFVELRSANKIDSVIATRSALLQRDGDIISADGTPSIDFGPTTPAGPHYVVVRHRNHLGIMTVDAPELSPIPRDIDFRDVNVIRHGKNSMRTRNGEFYMWGGDMNSDRKTIYQGPNNDIFQLFLKVMADPLNDNGVGGTPNANFISFGYLREDFDLDGKAIYQGPRNDRIMILLESILPTDSGNENVLANFILLEQLP